MLKLVLAVVALVAVASADPWDGTEIAELYINLGAINNLPSTLNCTRYANLFQPDGTLHSPGIPDATGTADIIKACQASASQVGPLISFQERNIAVQSWNMEKRLAFRWTINGVRLSDSTNVAAPAITAMWMDEDKNIEDAYSFYDDSLVSGTRAPGANDDPWNATELVNDYISMGSRTKELRNCSAWAALFTADGVSNEPGIPPNQGTDGLIKACQIKGDRFSIMIPAAEDILPVMSWDTTKRVAFTWTLTGVDAKGVSYVVPSITVLYLTPSKQITFAWDFWNTDLLPPGPI